MQVDPDLLTSYALLEDLVPDPDLRQRPVRIKRPYENINRIQPITKESLPKSARSFPSFFQHP